MGGRSSPGLLQRSWTYFIAGAALIAVGAFVFISAHPAQPVKIDSHVADYQVETKDGKYYANHLKLAGDSTDYVFDARDFQPSLPDKLEADAPITVWLDRGTTTVLAIELAGKPTRPMHTGTPTSRSKITSMARRPSRLPASS